ncbi:hypothetical protein ID0214_10760 [Helicobacter pylori]
MAVRLGIIFIIDDKTEKLRSILERKKECNYIKYMDILKEWQSK